MKRNLVAALHRVFCATAIFTGTMAHGLTVTPVYDPSFTGSMNFAALQTTVNNALAIYASNVSDNLAFSINFALSTTVGGAESSYFTIPVTYIAYRNALVSHAMTTNDVTVLAGLGVGPNDPVIGGTNVSVPQSLAFALGLSGSQTNYGTVTFNKDTYESNPAAFLGVIQHEVNEVLGTASSLPNNTGTATLPTTISPADLFRYTAAGMRSFDLNLGSVSTNKAFFRLSSGGPNQQEFNNLPNSGDYGDWYTGADRLFAPAPQDQAGDSTTFTSMSISPAELILLDAIGYSAFPVPEPGTVAALSSVALGWLTVRRRKSAPHI